MVYGIDALIVSNMIMHALQACSIRLKFVFCHAFGHQRCRLKTSLYDEYRIPIEDE